MARLTGSRLICGSSPQLDGAQHSTRVCALSLTCMFRIPIDDIDGVALRQQLNNQGLNGTAGWSGDGHQQSVLSGEPLPCCLLRHAERFPDAGPADAPLAQDGHVVMHGSVGLGDHSLSPRHARQHLIVRVLVP